MPGSTLSGLGGMWDLIMNALTGGATAQSAQTPQQALQQNPLNQFANVKPTPYQQQVAAYSLWQQPGATPAAAQYVDPSIFDKFGPNTPAGALPGAAGSGPTTSPSAGPSAPGQGSLPGMPSTTGLAGAATRFLANPLTTSTMGGVGKAMMMPHYTSRNQRIGALLSGFSGDLEHQTDPTKQTQAMLDQQKLLQEGPHPDVAAAMDVMATDPRNSDTKQRILSALSPGVRRGDIQPDVAMKLVDSEDLNATKALTDQLDLRKAELGVQAAQEHILGAEEVARLNAARAQADADAARERAIAAKQGKEPPPVIYHLYDKNNNYVGPDRETGLGRYVPPAGLHVGPAPTAAAEAKVPPEAGWPSDYTKIPEFGAGSLNPPGTEEGIPPDEGLPAEAAEMLHMKGRPEPGVFVPGSGITSFSTKAEADKYLLRVPFDHNKPGVVNDIRDKVASGTLEYSNSALINYLTKTYGVAPAEAAGFIKAYLGGGGAPAAASTR